MKKIYLFVNVWRLMAVYLILDLIAMLVFRTGRILLKRLHSPMVGKAFYVAGLVPARLCDVSKQVIDEHIEQLAN